MKSTYWKVSIAIIAILIAVVVGRSTIFGFAVAETPAVETAVNIDNFTFSPATVTIPPGSTVRWTNRDEIPHTVVSDDKSIRSKAMDTDESFSYTFTKRGTYTYFCSVHPKMTGKIVVQ
jgi:plastocyanin